MALDTKLFARLQPGGMFTVLDRSAHPGAVYYVDSTNAQGADAAGYGRNPDAPCLTLEYVIANFAAAGDEIILMPGHNEGGNAVLFDADVANLWIHGIGEGTQRARFDFDNAASTVDIGANGVILENIDLLPSAPSVLIGIDIELNVTDTTIKNCRFRDAETAGDEFVEAVQFKGGNHRTAILDNSFITEPAAGAATHAINMTTAACNRVRIEGNHINGNYSTAAIADGAASAGYRIFNNTIKVADGIVGITLNAGSTGHLEGNSIESTGLAVDAMIVAAACSWYDNKGVDTDGTQCQIIGTAPEEAPPDGAFAAGLNIYVDSEHGGAANTGTSWSDALDTIDAAVALCTDDHGDIIHLAPFHNEIVGGAAAIDLDVRGITLQGHGLGWMAPTLNFTTNTDTVEINAAGVVIDGVHFICGVANLAVMLDITANGDTTTVKNCEFIDLAAGAEVLVMINAAVLADRLHIHHNRFLSTAGGGATDAILLAGESLRTRIHDNIFMGDWASACIDGSGALQTDISIFDNKMNNVDVTTGLCINLHANSTGIVLDNEVHGGASAVDPIYAPACLRANNTGAQNEGVEAKSDLGVEVVRAASTIAQTGTLSKFTIAGGRVLVTAIIGRVTVNIQAQANAMSLEYTPTAGTMQVMCATLDINGDVIGTIYGITGVPTDAMEQVGLVMSAPQIMEAGTIEERCAANNTGEIQWTLYYKKIDAAATVVVA